MTFSTRVSAIPNLEVFLLKLRYKEGQLFELEGNRPQLLDDPQSVWIVYSGAVDIFSAPVAQDEIAGARHHLLRVQAGQALFGFDHRRHSSGLGLVAAGLPGTRILRLPRAHFQGLGNELEYGELVRAMIEDWVIAVSAAMVNGMVAPKDPAL